MILIIWPIYLLLPSTLTDVEVPGTTLFKTDGMMGRVTTLLGEHDLIITLTADDKATVGPFSGDKFNEAVRLVAGCGVMYRI